MVFLQENMIVNLYKIFEKGGGANNIILRNLIEAYQKNGLKSIAYFLEFFINALGADCEINPVFMMNAIANGSFPNFITDILQTMINYDEEKFIFHNLSTLNQTNDFVREFCTLNNPMLSDDSWMQTLTVTLHTIAQFATEYTISVGVYFSLKFAHDLEVLRFETYERSTPRNADIHSITEAQIKRIIANLLENTTVTLALSHSSFDHICGLFSALIRSSNKIYIHDTCILEQLMSIILVKHKTSKEILSLLDDIIKHDENSVKMRVVEFLSNYTETLFKLMNIDNVAIQVGAIKVVLAAQRILGKINFLPPNQNQIVYNKMVSSNNNMRETAKKFFILTYSNPNTINDSVEQQTMLQALMKQCEKYEESMQNLPVIMKLIWKNIPPVDEFLNQVCRTKSPIAYKILFYFIMKIKEPDVEDDFRRNIMNEILMKFSYIAASCEQNDMMHEIVIDMLYQMDLRTYIMREHNAVLRQIVEFVLEKMMNTQFLPTLFMVHMLLHQLTQFSDFAKEKIKGMMKDLAKKFIEKRDENVVVHLSAALYVHNAVNILPQKRRLDLLQATHTYLEEDKSHTSNIIHHVLAIHAEILSTKWVMMTRDQEEQVQSVSDFILKHIVPFMSCDIHQDRLFNVQIMQAFSLGIMNFVRNSPTEGYALWDNLQPTVYKYIQQVVFASYPRTDERESEEIYTLSRSFMNSVLMTLDCVQSPEHPIHISFSKFIFLLAKNFWHPEMLQRSLQVIAKDTPQCIKLLGMVCHSFCFYPEERAVRLFFHEMEQVILSMDNDDGKRKAIRYGVVLQYIENTGKYIRSSHESGNFDEDANKDNNRLGILRYIKDFLKTCTADQKKDIVIAQREFINEDYLNSREKESLKAFVKAVSSITSS